MEKISTTPLVVENNNNSNRLSGISSNTNTKANNVLNMDFDGMPKLNESSVRVVPSRTNFKKSNTCGSLFAKCNCDHHHHHHDTVIPLLSSTCDKIERIKSERNRRKTQSFSHPDTPIIFTEENRYPATTTSDLLNRLRATQETVIRSGNRRLEIKHSKRSSSPNLLNDFSTFVDIHPEFKVQVAPVSPQKQTRPILKKSAKSFPFPSQRSSSFRSFDSIGERILSSPSYSVDETSEDIELSGKVSDSLSLNDLDANAKSSPPSTTTVAEIHTASGENLDCKTNGVKAPLSPSKDATDENFLQVSITHVPFALLHSTHNERVFAPPHSRFRNETFPFPGASLATMQII